MNMRQLKSELPQSIREALKNFDQLPNSAFIRLPVVQRLYGISSASVWRGVKNGTIPEPKKLSARCTGWNVGLIRKALSVKPE